MLWKLEEGTFELKDVDLSAVMKTSTVHGFVRALRRSELTDRQTLRLIEHAWHRGLGYREMVNQNQRKFFLYCTSKTISGDTIVRIYQNYAFIFAPNGRLITMFEVPKNFTQKTFYSKNKSPVRNVRRYTRLNPSGDRLSRDYDHVA